jgi:hypothetical protein
MPLRVSLAGFAGLLVLTCLSCQPLKDDATRIKPSPELLVGTWIPDESTRGLMRGEGGYDTSLRTELVLAADGTYEMNNMPDWWWFDDGKSRKTFRTENGNWKVSRSLDGSSWDLSLTAHGAERSVEMVGQKTPYTVRFNFGHIDDNKYMTFVKEE